MKHPKNFAAHRMGISGLDSTVRQSSTMLLGTPKYHQR